MPRYEGLCIRRIRSHERLVLIIFQLMFAALIVHAGERPQADEISLHHHHDDPVRQHEDHALVDLVRPVDATHVVVRSGPWADAETWQGGILPHTGARVWMPSGLEVTIAESLVGTSYEWVRVDGTLRFAPDRDTGIKVVTLVIAKTGKLEIGSPKARVRPGKTATIEFASRGPRDRRRDPLDLSGGLISHGNVRIFGALVTGHMRAASSLTQGQLTVDLAEAPVGWKRGDFVVIPGTDPRMDQDEVIQLVQLDPRLRRLTLAKPLRYTHSAPRGADVPIGNLTRNVIFRSENPASLNKRGHIMIMHAQSGVVIDGAVFSGLGRTDTRIAHTAPVLDTKGALVPGTDANTIGRYPVHFHARLGARLDMEPNVFRNNVIVDSPKHGLVNHGGNVVAEGNVTFRADGTHFFAENGSEIGAFRRNLAIRSSGSALSHVDDGLISRMYVPDFGHGGHGYWVQGGGVEIIGNYAFGHKAAAYAINGHMMQEGQRWVFFPPANLPDPSIASGVEDLHPGDVPFRFSANQGAASFNGLDIWYSQIHAKHVRPSVVEDSFFWALERHGVSMPYTRSILFRNVTVLGSGRDPSSFGFGNTNVWADSLIFEHVRAEGFAIGVDMPTKGSNRIRDSYLDNVRNLRIRGGPGADLDLAIDNVTFGASSGVDILMQGLPYFDREEVLDGTDGFARLMPLDGDLSPFFGQVRVTVKGGNQGLHGKQIYFSEQAADAVPFRKVGIPALAGKTTKQVWDEFGIAVGGAVAPRGAVRLPRIVGLVGPPTSYGPRLRLLSDRFTKHRAGYVPRVEDPEGRVLQGAATDLRDGWNVVKIRGTGTSVLVCGDTSPPRFEIDEGFSREIHPDDLRFGVTVRGSIVDRVGAVKGRRLFVRNFENLVVDAGNMVRFEFTVEDAVGNQTRVPIALRVTREAVRRGQNSVYYLQGSYSASTPPTRAAAGKIR